MSSHRKLKLRAVVLGAGLMGRFHAAAIASAGGTLVAVVDPDLDRARTLAGGAEAFASLEGLRGREADIDVVHVCAPLPVHVELIEQAIALDAHTIAEKPLAPDAAATAALISAAEERGLMLVPVHQFLFQPGIQRLLTGRQRFGTLVRCLFESTTAGADTTGFDPDELVHEILPHPLALFSRFAPVPLEELEWLVVRPAPGELRAIAHASGTTFEIVISTRGRPTRARLELVGTRASAQADLYHGFAIVDRGAATRLRKATRPFTLAAATLGHAGGNLAVRVARGETAYPGLRELVRRTYDAVASGSPPPIAPRETLAVALARDAILGS
ncbi:MAG: Gfo/Idh/MocA family oxidoreductase [Actinobacteria bacterium]|nr:Gfo/Idh/MocA family oxidoreductase [Actinomycetota bacterium]